MKFSYIPYGIDAVVIDDFFTEEQLQDIMIELPQLTQPSIMATDTLLLGSAHYPDGTPFSARSGVVLNKLYDDPKKSPLISHTDTQIRSTIVAENLIKFNTMFKSLFHTNRVNNVLSYYEDSDYCDTHYDSYFFTLLTYFHTTPKQFTGGELVLKSCNSDISIDFEPDHNRSILILSSTMHGVNKVKLNQNAKLNGHGRYCHSTFLTII